MSIPLEVANAPSLAEIGISKILISENTLQTEIQALGERITQMYTGKNLLLISVLKGSFVFMADLVRYIRIPLEVDFLTASSYKSGLTSSGKVEVFQKLSSKLEQFHVVIVEDILDSGLTLATLKGVISEYKPISLRICTLLDKPERRQNDIVADFSCFTIPDAFVVGYGLDYNERYRNLPYIGIYDPELDVNK